MQTDGNSNSDFSDVGSDTGSTGEAAADGAGADFSDVHGSSSSTAPASGQTYTVKPGDNLRKIAQHFYGDEMKWHAIRDANPDKLPTPDKIQVGMKLIIPNA